MLEVSRVGVAESDDEIELSLELSIGGSYGKCEKPGQVIEESLSRENNERGVENVVPRASFSFSEGYVSVGGEQVEGESTGTVLETVDPYRKREIHALRRLEARRKREEKMRKSTVNFRGINANDKVRLEAQQSQERAQDRKIRGDENFLDDKSGRKKATLHVPPCVTNEAVLKNEETAIQNHGIMQMRGHHPLSQCVPLKNGCVYPYGAPSFGCGAVRKEENVMKEKSMFQPVPCGSFRPYLDGTGDIVPQNSGAGFDSGHINSGISKIVNQKAVSNGSLERSLSAISDYRSTSGKGGSISDTGSHSSYLRANDRELSVTATSDALNQQEVNASWNKETIQVPKNTIRSKESERGMDTAAANCKPDSKVNASTSKAENPTSSSPKQSHEVSDNPSKNEAWNGGMPTLSQMPCVSTTGNGPNGKTITGFLYRYTKTEVSIVCVCHGNSFSPAEFVEHAGGTDVTNPLRHITMVPSSFG